MGDPDEPRRSREPWLRVVREHEAGATARPSGLTPSAAVEDEPPGGREPDTPAPPEGDQAAGDPRAGSGHVVRALGVLVIVVTAGTAGGHLADRAVGAPADGRPALYVLVALALPFWDGLPARIGPRLTVAAAVVAAVAVTWFGLSMLAGPAWWRAEVSFGLACLAVGTAHLLLAAAARRRTRDVVP